MTNWRKLPDHPISVSDRGEVRAFSWGRWRMLKPYPNNKGYLCVNWYRDRCRYTSTVQRLVLTLFKGPRPNGKQCRHHDGDLGNNAAGNLFWGTPLENADDKRRHHPRGKVWKLSKEQAAEILRRYSEGESQRALAREFGISQPMVSHIVNGRAHRDVSGTAPASLPTP